MNDQAAAICAKSLSGPQGLSPTEAVLLDEVLLDLVQAGKTSPVFRLWVNDWCVVLGRNNKPEEWINEERIKKEGLPVIRRSSGGGTVLHHPKNLNYSWILPRAHAGLAPGIAVKDVHKYFLGIVIRALAYLDIEARHEGLSDVFVGERKVSGNAARIKSRAILHHGTILLFSEIERMEQFLKVPPNRSGVPHKGFVAGLWELGFPAGIGRLSESFKRATAEVLGWKLTDLELETSIIESVRDRARAASPENTSLTSP